MLDTLISSKNTFTYDTSKEIQEDACKAASCKNSTRRTVKTIGKSNTEVTPCLFCFSLYSQGNKPFNCRS
jgi:hypothetical protein